MAATSFRDRMNDLGWSRREPPVVNTQRPSRVLGTLAQYNPFGGESYVQLPTHEGEGPGAPLPARTRREEEEGWFARKSETFAAYMLLPAAARASAHAQLHSTLCSVGCPQTQGEGELTCFHACCLHLGLKSAMQDIVASLVLRKRVNCDPSEFLQLPRRATGGASRHAFL
jgi:hypothetical protein